MRPSVNFNLDKLNALAKVMSKHHSVKIGVLGTKVSRSGKGPTNAEVGAVHEFGSFTRKVPQRSFLRMPLHQRSSQVIAYVAKKSLKLLAAGNYHEVFRQLGLACEEVIAEAFATRGFGMWLPLSSKTISRKKHDMQLRQSGQLMRSISSKVEGA